MRNRTRVMSAALVLLLAGSVLAFAENGFLDLASPVFLGGGQNTATMETPFGTLLNPSISAGRERVTLDFSYVGLTQLSPFLWSGHVVNLGLALPTRAGVLSAIGRFATADYGASSGLQWGPLGGLNISFSKDLFPDLYVGVGLGGEFGADWGLGLDLGFLNLIGDVGPLKDFRWGGAIRNLGKPYADSTPGSLGNPPAFTPAIGASFGVVKTKDIDLVLNPDVSFPSFQDVRLGLGMAFSLFDVFFLDLAYTFDGRQVFGVEPSRSFPVSAGISLKLSGIGAKAGGQDVTEINSTVAAAPMEGGVYGFGLGVNVPVGVRDVTPPKIKIDTGEKYISPNFDGVKDDLVLPLDITDERYVKGYRFVITDSSGAAVRTILNKEDRPENRDVKNIVSRLAYLKTGITVPPSIRWDGMADSGTVVPDGTYHYHVEAWDDNNNLGKSPDGTVVVKTVPPSITLKAPYLIFSPDSDGNKDTLPIEQKGSSEDKWTGTVRNIEGAVVRTYTWENAAPASFEWDGKTDTGTAAPDGVYSYEVAATDRAGNNGKADVQNIIIDTRPTPVQLTIDQSFFSPGHLPKDKVTFGLGVPVSTGIENWAVVVKDSQGQARRSFKGTVTIPQTVAWDGKDDAGATLPEGQYKAGLSVVYVNGHQPAADSPVITIKTTPPTAATKADFETFSPTGDSSRPVDTIYQDTSSELFWTGAFKDSAGKDVRTFVWRGRADDKFEWDGRDDDGRLLADGDYIYSLTATDQAGNTGTSKPISIRIDTEKKPVRISTDLVYFSPFGSGPKTRVRISPSLVTKTGVDSYTVQVKGADGSAVRTYTGRARAPEDLLWDGIDDNGKRVADGKYTAALSVAYSNGTKPTAESTAFYVDNHVPRIDVSSPALLFSPTTDSKLQALTIKQTSSTEDLWEGQVNDSAGKKVHGWFWKGAAADVAWDGKDDNGNLMPDGYYSYVVKATSRAGISTTKELKGIQIDTRPTPVYVTADSDGFSPNGDGFKDTINIGPLVTLKDGITDWKLSMVEATAGEQQVVNGTGTVPGSWTWDGKDKSGLRTAPDGLYTAVLTVDYAKGNVATAKSTPFRLAVTPPKVVLSLDGTPFSPDNDGVNDELGIDLKVDDPVGIDSWQITILDPEQHPFTSFAGKGAPSEKIIWNGTSSTGELVQSAEDYPMSFTIKDELGNVATIQKTIPIDILVIRDGDKLRVRISSITFQANTADYANVEADKASKNQSTLQRLAEIFKKYSKYKIQIEGHANLVNFDNPAKAKIEQEQELLPLSKKRADSIRDALIALGIEGGRITTVGIGAAAPVVPFSDLDNRWKNRRVEFILVRQ
jgi:flagellar hook assembly protein FlgD/outer membrane protein OmpA-like peptidoglycan-associated protein